MTKPKEKEPAEVSPRTKQAGEVRARWAWTEPAVWTERMLTALEKGVKGGVWFSLIDKVWSLRNLASAFGKVKANKGAPGVDLQTVEMFERDLEGNLQRLSKALQEEQYQPSQIRRKYIDKPGSREKRPLGIPTIRDRVLQGALRHVLEPIFEREFAEHSYGFRPLRGCKDALRRVAALLKAGYVYVVDADLKSYFDTIPHDKLIEKVKERVADSRILRLIESLLKQGVMDGLESWTPEMGCPQGAVISPLLSNIYLNALDHLMAKHGYQMVRYADDFVILCRSLGEAEQALALVQHWTEEAELQLHPVKTRIIHAAQEGFDFLGYHFERGMRWPREKSLKKFKDTIRSKTRRCNGHSLERIIQNINRTLQGWFEYFKHSHRTTFTTLDGWIRMRLRSILRKRAGRKGRGRGKDHQRWPNAFFAEKGLFSMTATLSKACQSAMR